MAKKFLFGVANIVAMEGNNVVFTAKTLADSSITCDSSKSEVRGGQGNALQAIYYHSQAMNIAMTDVQFRLEYIAAKVGVDIQNVGSSVAGNKEGNFWTTETVTLNGFEGTITGNPAQVRGQNLSVYIEVNGEWKTVALDSVTKKFNVSSLSIQSGATICVMYLDQKATAKQIIVKSNFIPKRLHLYMTATLFGDTSGTGDVGKIQIEIPSAQLDSSMELSMTADGTSNTPLSAMALAYTDEGAVGCSVDSYYAKITQFITGSTWTDGVDGIAFSKDAITLAVQGTETLQVYARRGTTSFLCKNANLTFTSSAQAKATVSTDGVVTGQATGNSNITVSLTVGSKTYQDTCAVTVTGE